MPKHFVKLRAIHQLTLLQTPLPEDGRGWPVNAKPVEMRDLPYPFANYASISNDCDTITVKFDEVGLAFSYLRETLGLPIADSYFPDLVTTGRPVQVRFKGPQRPTLSSFEATAAEVKELSGKYIRKHHQGWFDTVHGFALALCAKIPVCDREQEEELQLAIGMRDPRPQNRRGVRVVAVASKIFPQSARFKFVAPDGWRTPRPPRYLIVRYAAPRGPQTVRIALRMNGDLRADLHGAPNARIVPICTPQWYLLDLWEQIGIDVEALHNIEVEVTAVGPDGSYVEIEDIFAISHTTAELDRLRRLLGMYNFTVSVFTSHGLGLVLSPSVAYEREAADTLRLADLPENPHYAVKVFRDHGIRFISSYSNTSDYTAINIDDLTEVNLLSDGSPFYDFNRYSYMPLKRGGGHDTSFWQRNGRSINHSLNDCLGDKLLGLLRDIAGKRGMGGLVYTHLYASNKPAEEDDPALYDRPFNAQTRAALAELSNRFYNSTGAIEQADRVFIASCATLLRLSSVKKRVVPHAYYDTVQNAVQIESWNDEVLNERIPARENSYRELRSLTFYVRDSQTARVLVDGEKVDSLIRNPADETGRESVTIVDTSAPLLIIGRLDPRKTKIALNARNGTITERPTDSDGESGLELILTDQSARLTIASRGINAANYQSFLLETQRSNPASRFKLTILFTGGTSVAISEFDDANVGDVKIKPWNDALPRLEVFPFYALLERRATDMEHIVQAGPGLGEISQIDLDVIGKTGDSFRLNRLALLRDSETLIDPKGAILGGQVPDSMEVRRVVLKDGGQEYETGTTTTGLYFFEHKIKRGSIVEVFSETHTGVVIEPINGRFVEIVTDKTDVDF